jgi:uncharacterized protein YqgC (DUF456 family)
MISFLKKSARVVIGLLLIVSGFIGMFIPIPVVPFFLLIFAGLAIMGVRQPWIDKAKAWLEAWRNRPK